MSAGAYDRQRVAYQVVAAHAKMGLMGWLPKAITRRVSLTNKPQVSPDAPSCGIIHNLALEALRLIRKLDGSIVQLHTCNIQLRYVVSMAEIALPVITIAIAPS